MSYVPNSVEGDILLPTWFVTEEELHEIFGQNSFPEYRVKNFKYHMFVAGKYEYGDLRQKLATFKFFISRGLQLARKKKYDCIMCYGWTLTGIAALILSWVTGAKLIVELGNTPQAAYQFNQFGQTYNAPNKNLKTRFARAVSLFLLHVLVRSASRVQMRFPGQLESFPRLQTVPASVIHSFTPVARVPYTGRSGSFVLLVGAPWYVKGVDVAIKAFRKVESEFPDVSLQLVGFYPDRQTLDKLIGNSQQIRFLGALPNVETFNLFADAMVYVSASRTDAGARALIEALAAGKPIIASRVDGSPYYIQDGINGLLFESEDSDELAERLRILLRSPELRKRFGEKGYELARAYYTESVWGYKFAEMVELVVGCRVPSLDTKQA